MAESDRKARNNFLLKSVKEKLCLPDNRLLLQLNKIFRHIPELKVATIGDGKSVHHLFWKLASRKQVHHETAQT